MLQRNKKLIKGAPKSVPNEINNDEIVNRKKKKKKGNVSNNDPIES